jgi:hypothetical protein
MKMKFDLDGYDDDDFYLGVFEMMIVRTDINVNRMVCRGFLKLHTDTSIFVRGGVINAVSSINLYYGEGDTPNEIEIRL